VSRFAITNSDDFKERSGIGGFPLRLLSKSAGNALAEDQALTMARLLKTMIWVLLQAA
jgi:hypothetical protein